MQRTNNDTEIPAYHFHTSMRTVSFSNWKQLARLH